jgi:hypothetical protein
MKIPKHCFRFVFFATALICLSCASAGKAKPGAGTAALLPLSAGWYQYDFERVFKGIEDEHNFALSTGVTMVQELTWKYTGVVSRFEDGALFDPVNGLELLIDGDGTISSAENISIRGRLEHDGRFFWGGLKEEHGRLNTIFVRGTLTPLPDSARGGREFDGVYHMMDTGTGREQLVRIGNGFYTWHYLDGEDAGFTPWPTLIRPDGTFSFSMDLTTVMEMGNFSSVNYSTGFVTEGKVIPGQGISVEEISRTSGMGHDTESAPHVFAGTMIRSGEFPNEAIPSGIESFVRSGREAIRTQPKPSPANYPSWYLRPPAKPGFIYATGEKTFEVRDTAFALAEAAAAANLAEQLWVRIESTIMDASNERGTRTDERIKSETLQRLNYRIAERLYNDETRTAFVLAELALD